MKFDAIQHLRDEIKRLDDGKGNPFVEGLKAQLSSYEKQNKRVYSPNPVVMRRSTNKSK